MQIKDLIGKTIISAKKRKHTIYDDAGYLDLEFSDKSKCCIVGMYGSYTGDSFDEYPTYIKIEDYGFEDK